MPASFDNSGKPAYMYDEVGDTWYAFGAKIDTASAYEWTNTQTYLNDVTFDDAVIFRDGFNNFLNPAARDAAITSPVQGTIVFVRQDSGGNTINQIQYYSGSAWTANDGDISQITAGTGLSGGGTAGNVTVSVDTAVVATTNNTLTMSNKTLTSPTVSGLYLSDSSIVFEGTGGDDANETTLTVTNPTADRTITIPDVTGTVTILDASQTLSNKTIALGSNTISGTIAEFNTAVTDADFATIAGTETLTNKTLTTPTINGGTAASGTLIGPEERWNIVASAATGTINIDTLTSGVWYYTSNATANHTLNFRGSSTTSMNTLLTTGDSVTVLWAVTNGATPYYPNVYQVDGTTSGVTVSWSGGTAPSAGNASGIDVYSFTIVKTANATFRIFAAGAVKYA